MSSILPPSSHFDVPDQDQVESARMAQMRERGRQRQHAEITDMLERRERERLEREANRPVDAIRTVDGVQVITQDGTTRPMTEQDTADDNFADYLSSLGIQVGQDQQDPFVGPGGVTFGTPDSTFPSTTRASLGPSVSSAGRPIRDTLVDFRYRSTDPAQELLSMSPGKLLTIQRKLQQGGLIRSVTGRPDSASIDAMTEVMGIANSEGRDWQTALDLVVNRFQSAQQEADAGAGAGSLRSPTFTFDPYTPPDYDTLTGEVRQLFRQQLGRDPEPHELTTLADKMRSLHRSSYDQQRAAAQQKFQAEVAAQRQSVTNAETGQGGPANPVTTDAGVAGEQVDVGASIQSIFDERFGGEVDRVERAREALRSQSTSLSALLGGRQFASPSAVNRL